MINTQHSFSIENKLIADSEEIFGPAYAGQFVIRRPSLGDKRAISLKDAASMSVYGQVNSDMVGEGTKLLSYIVIFVSHLAEAPLPTWFSLDKLYSERDEESILCVWQEVTAWLATFRSVAATGNSGVATGEFTPVVPT